jgi:hypothetical protein
MLKTAAVTTGAGDGNGTVTSVGTGTGLTGGPITTTGTISLANTSVTAGTYGSNTGTVQIVVDDQGRINSASNVQIVSLSDLTGALATPNNIDFAVTPTTGGAVGRLIWNATDGTLNLGMIGGNVTQQIGQEAYVYVRNNTGSTLLNGKVARLTGSIGTRATVALAAVSDPDNTIGILTEDIANNAEGLVTTFGLVRDLDTSGFTEGAQLYLSNSTPGELTETVPTGVGAVVVSVAFCVRSHPTQGALLLVGAHTVSTILGNTTIALGNTTTSIGNLALPNVTLTTGNANITTMTLTANSTANATFGTSSLPLVPLGYIVVNLNGTNVKVPYYAV